MLPQTLPHDRQVQLLETALNRRQTAFTVELANVGNPDFRQDPDRPLPDTTCGWAHVNTLQEVSDICMLYIHFYDLGGGNWSGGRVVRRDGLVIGRVAYNGRIFEGERFTGQNKCLYEPGC